MKKHLTLALLLLATMAMAEPYYVKVGDLYYETEMTSSLDFQGRDQYVAYCVPLHANDLILCYDAGNKATWSITTIDQGDTWGAKGFTADANGLKCTITGNYDLYIKLKYEDDVWYIEGPNSDCTPATPADPTQGGGGGGGGDEYDVAAPARCPDVLLQGFYWNSYEDHGYGRTKWVDFKNNGNGAEIGRWFDLVWLPPCTKSSGGLGYHPTNYSSLESGLGTAKNLLAIIDTFHVNGCRVVADVVVNHCDGNTWCTFNKLDFGPYGKFEPTAAWICNTDEVNFNTDAGDCMGSATGGADDGYGYEANYAASRDWDHGQQRVRDMIKAYLQWLRYEVGFDGFRYDYCKGFHMSHVNDYNKTAKPYFSVLEYWDGNVGTLQSRLNEAGWNTLTFDFGTKYQALNDGIAKGNYGGCRGAGLLGAGKGRYACTFVDSHDSFQRDGNEFGGAGQSMNIPDRLVQANAYILSMPGVPCVFYPHWVTFKEDIKALINARYKTGVHSESSVSDEAGNGKYVAWVEGTNGTLCLKIGPNSGYGDCPAGYEKAYVSTNYKVGVYIRLTSPRGDKDQNRKPIVPGGDTALPTVTAPHSDAVKVMVDGRILIRREGTLYNIQGIQVQ